MQIEVRKVYPPESIFRECPTPELKGSTWNDIAVLAEEALEELKKCNKDKELGREWMRGEE